jgi:hypothetical protein
VAHGPPEGLGAAVQALPTAATPLSADAVAGVPCVVVSSTRRGWTAGRHRQRSGDGPVTEQRSSGLGAGPPATEAHRERLVEGLLEHGRPRRICTTHLPCRLSHVTPGKPDLLALGMAALPCGTEVSVETGSAAL